MRLEWLSPKFSWGGEKADAGKVLTDEEHQDDRTRLKWETVNIRILLRSSQAMTRAMIELWRKL